MRDAHTPLRTGVRLVLALATVAGVAACSGSPTDVQPGEDDAQSLLAATPAAVLQAMGEAIRDEYRAEMTYEVVIDAFGAVRPFVNIINAEVRHSEALATLYGARGLPVPGNEWTAADIPAFATLASACETGVVAEIENAAIYDGYLSLDLPPDVRQVFQSNRDASVNNHLPAFQRCAG